MSEGQRIGTLVVVGAVIWHLLTVLSPPWHSRMARLPVPADTAGGDYATYHYAIRAAAAGLDPYDKAVLDGLARDEGTRRAVHPYLYPPPFLWTVAWTLPLSLSSAFAGWFLLRELALLAAGWVLWRWWSPWSGTALPAFAAGVAVMYAFSYEAELGQANTLVLALVLAGGWLVTDRPREAGALVGLACMWKMSPALIVLWWASERNWRAVGAAAATALALTVITLPLVGLAEQWRFYTDVLPGLGAGDYNGLRIKIGMVGNHSVPNVFHQLLPSGVEDRLSVGARVASTLVSAGLVGGLGMTWSRQPAAPGSLAAAARFSAVLVVMLLVPVYTYAHHLAFALPALVLAVVAVDRGLLTPRWAAAVGGAAAVLAFPQPYLTAAVVHVVGAGTGLGAVVQELPLLALIVVLAAMMRLGVDKRAHSM